MIKKLQSQEYYSIHCIVIASELKRANYQNMDKIKLALHRLDILLAEANEKIRKLEAKTPSEKLREVLEVVEELEWNKTPNL